MSVTSQIRQLQNPANDINIYPLTVEEAVFDGQGNVLATKIQNLENRPLWTRKGTCTFANLPSVSNASEGDLWNVSDSFTTTADFRSGAGVIVPAGSDVYMTDNGKWDVLVGSTADGANLAPIESSVESTRKYEPGDYLVYHGVLYFVTDPIAIGDSLLPGYNIRRTSMSQELMPISDTLEDETVEGNPLNFSVLSKKNAFSTKITLDPIQDLHGYDKPWIGGAGKNLLPMTVEGIKALNTGGTWVENTCTLGNVAFTILTDSGGNITGISATGTPSSDDIQFALCISSFPAGTYILTGGISNTLRLRASNRGTGSDVVIGHDSGSGLNVSLDEGNIFRVAIRISVDTSTTVSQIFYPMFRLATESDDTFEPYTNICPISGRTQVGLRGCGKNLLDITLAAGEYTVNGITFTVLMNANGSIEGIKATGTATNIANLWIMGTGGTAVAMDFDVSGKILNGCPAGGSSSKYRVRYQAFKTATTTDATDYVTANDTGDGATLPNSVDYPYKRMYIQFANGYVIPDGGLMFYPMISNEGGAYEPYQQSNDLTISLGQTVYGGTVDVEKGELVVDRTYVSLNESKWAAVTGNQVYRYSEAFSDRETGSNYNLICSAFKADNSLPLYCRWNQAYEGNFFGIAGTDASNLTAEQLNAMSLAGEIEICYPLATPTVIPLTPAQVHLLKGINNISTDGDNITLIYKEIPFAYESELDDKADNDTIASVETGTTVSQAYSVGQYMMWDGDLYKVTANIANGGTITPGTNVTKTTVAAELLAIISQL